MVKKTDKIDTTKDAKVVEVKTGKEKKEAKEKAPVIEIIRGRMPLPIVHMIKFGTEEQTVAALSAKYRTTGGKVNDIRTDANFGYITEDYVPSADMIEKAKAYAEQLDDKEVLKALGDMKPATDEQNEAFAEARKGARKTKPKEDKPAEGEGETTEVMAVEAETVEAPIDDNELNELTA